MSDDFQVGDVVVCINAKPDSFDPKAGLLKERAHYRVAVVGPVKGVFCLGFRALPADKPNTAWAWNANRFRKLPRADEQFTEMLRALKPTRAPVSA